MHGRGGGGPCRGAGLQHRGQPPREGSRAPASSPPPRAGELRDITPTVQAFRGVTAESLTRQNIDIWIAGLWSNPFISLSGMNRAKRK